MPSKTPAPPPSSKPEPAYPAIEGFIERATQDEVDAFFSRVRGGLSALKGPRAEQAKKVKAAIDDTQELLGYLLQIRQRLESDRSKAKGRK